MRHPTRTLRLPIAAVLSLLAFVVVFAAEVNSFSTVEIWQGETGRSFELFGGRIVYQHPLVPRPGPSGRMSFKAKIIMTPKRRIIADAIWGFAIHRFAIHSMIDPSDVDKFFYRSRAALAFHSPAAHRSRLLAYRPPGQRAGFSGNSS